MSGSLPVKGTRVALVKLREDKRAEKGLSGFGVAMRGGKYVVPLPEGYDGMTSVFWVEGWIVVRHPDHPPLLADTTKGTTSSMNEFAMAAAMRAFERPSTVH